LFDAGYGKAIRRDGDIDTLVFGDVTIIMDRTVKSTDIEVGSILSQREKRGKVELKLNGEVAQMDVAKAREVVQMLHEATEAAISDELLFTFLTTRVGIDPEKAGAALLDFRELRQGSRDTVRPN